MMRPQGYDKLDDETKATFDSLVKEGMRPVSMGELESRLKAIGYKLDYDGRAYCRAKWMTGELAGRTYDCCTLAVVQADNGLSFANIEARRDDNYRAFQEMRESVFSLVPKGGSWYIAEL